MADENVQTGSAEQQQNQQTPEIDYSKLESILDKKIGVTEAGVMKSFFKQQGLTEDEAKQAMNDFKANRDAQKDNAKAELTQTQQLLQELQAQLQQNMIEKKAMTMAQELGVDIKTVPYVTKLADFKNAVDENGNVKDDEVKVAIEKVLEDVPAFKVQDKEAAGGFKIGSASGSGQTGAGSDQLAQIFGNKK